MIHHISIAAHQPEHVSQVLAEFLQGQSIPFPGHPGSYIALALDTQGTMIEVHPLNTILLPETIVQLQEKSITSNHSAFHAAISVSMSKDKIQAIADREGWRMVHCDRQGYFEVIELWVENQLLIELLPPELAAKYLAFTEPRSLLQFTRSASIA